MDFTVPSYPGTTFHAPIARISHDLDLKTRTMPVELDVRNPQHRLDPGIFAQVLWPVERPCPTFFVPSSAVATNLQRTFVIRVRQGKAEWVDVTTGLSWNGQSEVFGDFKAGDVVIRNASDSIHDGTSVSAKSS